MARVERLCPAMGLTPIPDVQDVGVVHDLLSFEQYFAPTCWLYEKSSELVHERCVAKRTDFPLEIVKMDSPPTEIPQACYNATYMMFPSANWESKAKKMRRKGGTFSVFEKFVVMPYTGTPQNVIPAGWKPIMADLEIPKNLLYRIRRNLVTEMAGATADDHAPAFRDSHEASQDQAEEALDEKEKTRSEVTPLVSTAFSFSSEDREFDEETGEFSSAKLTCPLCGPTRRDPHKPGFEADSTTRAYTDQQLIAGRAIHASFTWLNREKDEIGKYKERRLARTSGTLTSAIVPVALSKTELNLKGRAELLPLDYEAHSVKIMVRPDHPVTRHAMTSKGEVAQRLPLCSELLQEWAMGLITSNPIALTKTDPLSSPDLLFPMPDRGAPLCHITPNDVKLLV